jgi:thioredoxin reductase (NADPH)
MRDIPQPPYDLIIIGAGSAGMSAAIYAGRAKLKTLVLERDRVGGQIKITSEVENYPGIPRTSGEALSQTMRKQAESFGVTFSQAIVESVDFSGSIKQVCTVDGCYEALAVIVATGAVPRTLGFAGEEEYRGRGIGYCATCDGEFFAGMDIFVIGGGLAATEEALFLTRYARKVTLIVRGEKLSVPRRVADKLFAHPKIEPRFKTELVEAGGDALLRFATFIDRSTGETWRYEAPSPNETFGIFVFAGYIPQSAEYANALRLDDRGYITTDEGMRTNVDGIYAAGDVRPKELRQLVTAVADGAIAATNAEKYVEALRIKLGLPERAQDELPTVAAEAGETTGAIAAAGVTGAATAAARDGAATAAGAATPGTAAADKQGPACPAPDEPSPAAASGNAPGAIPTFFDDDLVEQLLPVLERLEREIGIVAVFDGDGGLDNEVRAFLSEFMRLTDRVRVTFLRKGKDPAREQELGVSLFPTFVLTDKDGHPLGVQFHGVPSGHEINSFILALYNAAGPGQSIDETLAARVASQSRPVNIKVGVSLSCTLCPDVVAAAQLMALRNPNITAEMIDVAHFPAFKSQWGIMSVPAVVIDDERISFGKKTPEELLNLIEA